MHTGCELVNILCTLQFAPCSESQHTAVHIVCTLYIVHIVHCRGKLKPPSTGIPGESHAAAQPKPFFLDSDQNILILGERVWGSCRQQSPFFLILAIYNIQTMLIQMAGATWKYQFIIISTAINDQGYSKI